MRTLSLTWTVLESAIGDTIEPSGTRSSCNRARSAAAGSEVTTRAETFTPPGNSTEISSMPVHQVGRGEHQAVPGDEDARAPLDDARLASRHRVATLGPDRQHRRRDLLEHLLERLSLGRGNFPGVRRDDASDEVEHDEPRNHPRNLGSPRRPHHTQPPVAIANRFDTRETTVSRANGLLAEIPFAELENRQGDRASETPVTLVESARPAALVGQQGSRRSSARLEH